MKFKGIACIFFVAGVISLLLTQQVFATVTITTATGGSAISADATGGVFASLTGPVITEIATADIGTGTIILNVPTGFIFDTGGTAPTVLVARTGGSGADSRNINDLASGSTIAVTRTATTLTITITAATSNGVKNSLTWQNVRVRPSAGTPLASGNIVKTGTSVIAGITNSVTNLGTLTEVVGVKNKLAFTTQPSTTATINTDFAIKPVIKLQDQFGNTVTSDNTSAITRTAVLSTQVCGGTAGSGTLTSTPASGAAVTAGAMTYTAMQYSFGESIKICATSVGVTSTLSDAISVNIINTTTTLNTSNNTLVYGTAAIFTATVTPASGGAPSGTVTFKNGVTTIGTGILNGANPGVAIFSTSTLSVAGSPHSITAVYGGDSAHSGSTSSAVLQTITPKNLTVAGITASSKTYNQNIIAALSGTPGTLVGIVFADDVTLIGTAVGNFSDKNVGNNKTVTVSGQSLTGTKAFNYTLTEPTTTANITALNLTVAGITANDKVYDGGMSAILNLGSAILVGVISGDAVNLNTGVAVGNFNTPNVGLNKTVTISGLTITGVDSGNYTLTQPTTTASITNPVPTITSVSPVSKTAGDVGFVLTVNGTNFITNSVVNFQGSARATSYVSATQLTATILTGDLTTAGNFSITVTNPTPGGGTSNAQTFTVSAVVPTITSPTATSITSYSATLGADVTSDGGDTLTSRGTCWGTSAAPITNCVAEGDITTGIFTHSITGLPSNTLIYYRGYATNSAGTGYSEDGTFYTVVADNPVPTTTSISPTSKNAGDPGFTLTVNGTNFVASSTVQWNGSDRATSYVSATQLTATINASDITSAGSASITVFNPLPGGGNSNSQTLTINAVATKFVIILPANGTVDDPITVTIQAQKADNFIDTNYQQDVTLDTTGSATGGGLVDIVNGVGTKDISDIVPETVTLSLSDSEGTGLDFSSTQDVTFSAGALAQFSLNHPTVLSAGSRAAYTVTREDQHGNLITSGENIIYFYSYSTGVNKKFYDAATAGNEITSVTISNSQSSAQIWYYDETPGTWSIAASDVPVPDGNVGVNDAVDSLQVVAGPVSQFILSHPGLITAGTRASYEVIRKDQFNNLVSLGATTVFLSSNSTGSDTPLFYNAVSGGSTITSFNIPDGQSSANFWYFDPNPGTWAINVSDSASPDGAVGIADAVDTLIVSSAPIIATRFVILPPTNGTVDAPISVVVQAQDDSGNIDTTYQDDVTLAVTGSATGGGLVDIVNGVGTKNISDVIPETITLTLADSQSTGLGISSSQTVAFSPGAVAQFFLDNPGDVAAGARVGYNVIRKDQYGNLVTAGATTVYLYSTSDGVNKKFYEAISDGSEITSVVISDGQSSAAFWYYDEKAESWFITASDATMAPPDGASGIVDASDAITVQPAAVAKFVINDPGDMTAGTRLGYTVIRRDQFDNLVTSGVTLAYLYSSSSGTTKKFYDSASGGFEIAFATFNDGQSSNNFWYYDQTSGSWVITVSDSSSSPDGAMGVQDAVDSVIVSSVPIVATRFVIQPIADSTINIPVAIIVQAEDDSGNIDTTYQDDVTLTATGSATGDGLVDIVNGVGTKNISDAVAETVTLTLSDTQSTGLDISSVENIAFSAVPVAPIASGGAPRAVARIITGVQLSGLAFSSAKIEILAISPQGTETKRQIKASANGSFTSTFSEIVTGANAYGVVGIDTEGRVTQTKIFGVNYTDQNSFLKVDKILLSPTLGLIRPTVTKGDFVGFIGSAVPGYTIEIQIDDKIISTNAISAPSGLYKILFSTVELSNGSHTVRTRQVSPVGVESDYAPQKVFVVTSLFTPQTDFNQDGAIDIRDWSVFLSRWTSIDPLVRKLDDLNGDGKIDVTDFSIFARTVKF